MPLTVIVVNLPEVAHEQQQLPNGLVVSNAQPEHVEPNHIHHEDVKKPTIQHHQQISQPEVAAGQAGHITVFSTFECDGGPFPPPPLFQQLPP